LLVGVGEEAGEFAPRDREGEGRIAVVGAGDRGVDPDDAPALVDERAARIAARYLGGVDQHRDPVDRLHVRHIAFAARRGARGDIVVGAARGREVDVAGVAEGDDVGARIERAGIDRRGGQAALGDLDQREVARGIDRDQLARETLFPFRRDDAERDIAGVLDRRFDDMRVGDDPRRRNRDAAAMAEADNLAVDHRDGDDAHDAARCGADVVGGARGRRGREGEGKEGEQHGEEAGHGAHTSQPGSEGKRPRCRDPTSPSTRRRCPRG
jgi:hypothetical protein